MEEEEEVLLAELHFFVQEKKLAFCEKRFFLWSFYFTFILLLAKHMRDVRVCVWMDV